MDVFLSPREMARVIGSSESSLKRWADEGLLEVSRTGGGHRRIAVAEALRFIREMGFPVVDPQPLGMIKKGHLQSAAQENADELLRASLMAGDMETTRGLLMAMYLQGRDVAELCDGPLTLAMRSVGELWKEGPGGIHREHCATEVCAQALHYLAGRFPKAKADAPVAVGGSMEEDPYMLPSLMAATCLRAMGWQAINLGANLPFSALESALAFYGPGVELAWLSCSVGKLAAGQEKRLSKLAQRVGEMGIELVVGGRGWASGAVQAAGARYAGNMREMTAYAAGLGKGRAVAKV